MTLFCAKKQENEGVSALNTYKKSRVYQPRLANFQGTIGLVRPMASPCSFTIRSGA